MKINNIDFEIKNVNIEIKQTSINYISINAFTKTDNYFKINKWFGDYNKKDIIYNTVQIYGIFPIDYTFEQHGINVTLSADHINGDLSLFNKQKLRREKLSKIKNISDGAKSQ